MSWMGFYDTKVRRRDHWTWPYPYDNDWELEIDWIPVVRKIPKRKGPYCPKCGLNMDEMTHYVCGDFMCPVQPKVTC